MDHSRETGLQPQGKQLYHFWTMKLKPDATCAFQPLPGPSAVLLCVALTLSGAPLGSSTLSHDCPYPPRSPPIP